MPYTMKELRKSISAEVSRLLSVYREHTDFQPVIGGAQNLIVKEEFPSDNGAGARRRTTHNLFAFDGRSKSPLNDLPIQVQFYILTYLSPVDLCQMCQTSRHWYVLSTHDFIWRDILERSSLRWDRISHDRNPDFFKRVNISSKNIYLQCHPNLPSPSSRLPNLLSLFVGCKPRVVMFGPGLDSKTSKLVRSILADKNGISESSRFKVTGMVPGEFAGVGSGISLRFAEYNFNLVTLYSNTKSVRQGLQGHNRVQGNKLFTPAGQVYELTTSVQELCSRSHAFIYVIDATNSVEEISTGFGELSAMLCESPSSPLLVLACSRGTWSPSYQDGEPTAVINIARALRLGRLDRKWSVQAGEVETLHGVRSGFQWLLHHINPLQTIAYS